MQADIVARFRAGELLALGYATPRHANDPAVPIPTEIWGGKIDWDEGTVSSEGLSFVAVKIPKPDAVAAVLLTEKIIAEPPRPVGRPSFKVEIHRAYDVLKIEGRIDFSRPMHTHYQLIRDWLAAHYTDRSQQFLDLGRETIRKELGPRFKADKATKKP